MPKPLDSTEPGPNYSDKMVRTENLAKFRFEVVELYSSGDTIFHRL